MTVSAYARKTLLSANNGRFTFEVKTDDIDELGTIFSNISMRFDSFIGALRYRNELYANDITYMKKMLEDLKSEFSEYLREVRNDRKFIKKKGIQYLEGQIDRVLGLYEPDRKNNMKGDVDIDDSDM